MSLALCHVLLHKHGLEPNRVAQSNFRAETMQARERLFGDWPEIRPTAYDRMRLSDTVDRHRDAPWFGERCALEPRPILPEAVRQELHEESRSYAILDQLGGEWLKQGFTARVDHVHGAEPRREISHHLPPVLDARVIFPPTIFPNVAMDTARVTALRQHEHDRRRPTEMREPAPSEVAQMIVDALVQALVKRTVGRGYVVNVDGAATKRYQG
jgi:hypothetical protein